jgi:hypothetical protein
LSRQAATNAENKDEKGGVMISNSGDNRPVNARNAQGVYTAEAIPMFSGRPRREKVIGREDLMDLDIILHTCDTVEAFLAKA